MKLIAVLCLILAFWCHQTQHQLFMLINTSPLSLASEEFIPLHEEPPESKKEVSGEPQPHNEFVSGSQSDSKSDIGELEPVDLKLPKEAQSTGGNPEGKETVVHKNHEAEAGSSQVSSSQVEHSSNNGVGTEKLQTALRDSEIKSDASSADSLDVPTSTVVSDESIVATDLNKLAMDVKIDNSSAAPSTPSPSNESFEKNQTSEKVAEDSIKSDVPPTPSPDTTTTVAPPTKEDEPIPSFMEWTQLQHQKLHESNGGTAAGGQAPGQNGQKGTQNGNPQQNKSTPTATPGIVATKSRKEKESTAKNFASPDCGAKVIQSNPESQNANGVLSSSHDEYMLNKCGIPVWFVIELCEPLKIEKVSLGNLELFSSSPKDIEIGISDRYPTRDWTKLGPFTLPEIRAIHSINFPSTNASTFGKFLKVNVLSHYGTEHFCPLSLVRVNGISEYEVLESENIHPGDISESEKEESALYEEPVIDNQNVERDSAADKSVFGSAKDTVINIVKKAAEMLGKTASSTGSAKRTGKSSQPKCRSLLQCLPNYEATIKEHVLSLLSCNFSNLLPFLNKNSPWCGWDYCHALFSKHSIGLPWQPEGFYASVFGGPTVLYALCNYHRPLTKESCETLFVSNVSAPIKNSDNTFGDGYINDSLKFPPVSFGTSPEEDTEAKEKAAEVDSNLPGIDGSADQAQNTSSSTESENKDKIEEPEPAIQTPISEQPLAGETSGESAQAPVSQAQPPQSGNLDETTVAPTTSTSQNTQQQPTTGQQQQQQKESVFVRLSNRIKTLERNQSLTASYLEELSRRFKKQNEENSHTNEGTKNFMNESRYKFKILEDFKSELRSLRRNTYEIRERLFNVQLQRSLLIVLCLLQFVGIVSVCMWVRKRFRQLESRLENMENSGPVPAQTIVNPFVGIRHGSPQHILGVRKRVNSECSVGSGLSSIDKSKKLKKKKKKFADLKPVNIKSSPGPSSAPIDYQSCKTEREFKFQYPTPIPTSMSAYNIPVTANSNFKENIKPEHQSDADFTLYARSASPLSTPMTPLASNVGGNSNDLLSTQVDSPFAMMSSTSSNFFVEPGVSTSSRYALLASPGPLTAPKTSVLKRSGSLTSLESSSTSSYGTSKTGSQSHSSVMNGHHHNDGQTVINGSGKKRKSKGLKALMPKLFDR